MLAPFLPVSLHQWVKSCGIFFHVSWYVIWRGLCWVSAGSSVAEDAGKQHSCTVHNKLSQSSRPGPQTLIIVPAPLSRCFLSLRCRSHVIDVTVGAGHLMVT